jgi:hypothetical protein
MNDELSNVLIFSEPQFEYDRKNKSYLYYFFQKLCIFSFIIGTFSLIICLMYNKDLNNYNLDENLRDIYVYIVKTASIIMIISFSISLLSLSYLLNSET